MDEIIRILLIDDDEDEYFILQDLIASRPEVDDRSRFTLEWVETYSDAVEAFQKQEYDVYLVDYRLGPYSGLDLLNEANTIGIKAPIILLTGQGNYEVDLAAMQAGAADYLSKDQINSQLLERSIRYAIEQKGIQDELERRVRERTRELQAAKDQLEERVADRTAELRQANEWLEQANQRLENLNLQLESERARLSTVIANIPVALMVADENGQVILTNYLADQLSLIPSNGHARSAPNATLSDIDGRPFQSQDLPFARPVNRGEAQVNLEVILQQPDKDQRFFLVNSAPILNRRGRIRGAVAVFQDITQRKANEERIRKQAVRAEVLATLSQAFTAAGLDLSSVLNAITSNISRFTADASIIRLASADGAWLEPVAFHHKDPVYLAQMQKMFTNIREPSSEGPAGSVFKNGLPILIRDIAQERSMKKLHLESIYLERLKQFPLNSFVILPLQAMGRKVGVLVTGRGPDQPPFTEEDKNFLQDLADRAALAIENARLYSEVQKISLTDPLTGLYNRRGLNIITEREIERAHRFRRSMSFILLDIDRFKAVNDTYGHAIGDDILKILAGRLQKSVRDVDIVSRFGGEEFLVVLPESDLCSTREAAERLRKIIANEPFQTSSGPISITISLGLSCSAADKLNFEFLLENADAALYRAKENGRNRVEIG